MENKKLKFAIYSRKSRFSEKGESIENQIDMCKEYIRKNYMNIDDSQICIYEDEGFSGKSLKRPQFQKMMSECEDVGIDYIVVYRLDRISRNVADFSSLIDELNNKKISFICIKEQFDTSTPMGRAMMYIASVFAQLERETIAERIKDNMYMLAKDGRWLGGKPPLGYGYKEVKTLDRNNVSRKYYILEQNSDIGLAKLLYDKMLESASITKVVEYCYINNLKTLRNCDFSLSTVRNILENPIYCVADEKSLEYFKNLNCNICCTDEECNGEYAFCVYNKFDHDEGKKKNPEKWIVAVGKHKGIISSENWLRVQNILLANAHKGGNRKIHNEVTLLSGILRCKCGAYMRPKKSRSTKKRKYNFHYMCELKERSKRSRCNQPNINGNILDEVIINELFNYGTNNSIINKQLKIIEDNINKTDIFFNKEKNIKGRILECQTLISNLVRKMADTSDVVSKIIQEEIEKYDDELNNLQKELQKIKSEEKQNNDNIKNLNQIKDSIQFLKEKYNDLTIVQKREYLKNVLNKVVWDGENINIFIKGCDDEGKLLAKKFPLVDNTFCGMSVTETFLPPISYSIKYIYGSTLDEEMLANIRLRYKNVDELTLGQKIFYIRITKGYTIEELSNITNISYNTIFRYEQGIIGLEKPNLKILQTISTACGKDKYFLYNDYYKFKDISDIVLIEYQKSNKLTNEKMAIRFGVSTQTIKKWKKKGYSPSLPLFEKLLKDFFIENFLNNSNYFSINDSISFK